MDEVLADQIDQIRRDSLTKAVYAYGTGYIFERRANSLRMWLRVLVFLGIAVPASIGGIVMSSLGNTAILPVAMLLAGVLGLIQLVGSIWSLVARWDDSYSYALESLNANYRLAEGYRELAKDIESPDFHLRYKLLNVEDHSRSATDNQQGITDREKRRGMRAALRQYQMSCACCGKVPVSMTSSSCDVCGNF